MSRWARWPWYTCVTGVLTIIGWGAILRLTQAPRLTMYAGKQKRRVGEFGPCSVVDIIAPLDDIGGAAKCLILSCQSCMTNTLETLRFRKDLYGLKTLSTTRLSARCL